MTKVPLSYKAKGEIIFSKSFCDKAVEETITVFEPSAFGHVAEPGEVARSYIVWQIIHPIMMQ